MALGLHGLLSLGLLLPKPPPPPGLFLPPQEVFYDIELLLLEEQAKAASGTPSAEPSPASPGAKRRTDGPSPLPPAKTTVAPGPAEGPASPPAPPPTEGPTAPPPTEAAPTSPTGALAPTEGPAAPPADEYGGSPDGEAESGGLPGLGGVPVYALNPALVGAGAGGEGSVAAPPARRPNAVPEDVATTVLTGSLRTRDAELGLALPAAGTVQSTVVTAVQSSDAPADSRGTFEITLAPDGSVSGVRVVRFSAGQDASWSRIAAAIAAELAKKRLPMGGANERGAIVTVTVESKVLYPAGTKEKVEMRPVCADEVARAAIDPTGELTQGTEQAELPCIPIGMALRGDLANLGTKPSRVLSTKVRVEIPGEKALVDPKLVDTRVPWLAPREGEIRRSDVVKRKKKKKKK